MGCSSFCNCVIHKFIYSILVIRFNSVFGTRTKEGKLVQPVLVEYFAAARMMLIRQ